MSIAELQLGGFADADLTDETLLPRLLWLREIIAPRLERYLGYYRNPTSELARVLPCAMSANFSGRPFRQYQELGLPARITGFRRAADGGAAATGSMDVQRKEVVVENDIAWRVNTLVDFVAGRMPAISSTAREGERQRILTSVIHGLLDAAGGVMLLQRLVLEGAVSGSAWIHIRPTAALLERLAATRGSGVEGVGAGGGGPGAMAHDSDIASTVTAARVDAGEVPALARWFQLEIVRASDLCPLPRRGDVGLAIETMPAYAALVHDGGPGRASDIAAGGGGLLGRMRSWLSRPAASLRGVEEFTFDLFGAGKWQRYVRGVLTQEGENALGFVPFVRYENAVEAAAGQRVGPAGSGAVDVGLGEVEPLIGLQDELNTRLSDRAYRVTMTSFRMWLGRGVEDFTKRPIMPGQMWSTDNTEASIEGFGGDAGTPSEESHIEQVREALDKISGVPPVAAGVLRDKLGNLTSAVALKVTLISLLARTDRKRAALTQTLGMLVERLLGALDAAGIVASTAEERGIDVNWPTAMPESDMDRLTEAQAKVGLGVPRSVVLRELGYEEVADETRAMGGSAARAGQTGEKTTDSSAL